MSIEGIFRLFFTVVAAMMLYYGVLPEKGMEPGPLAAHIFVSALSFTTIIVNWMWFRNRNRDFDEG